MRVLVTGAGGGIGRVVTQSFVDEGHVVIGVDRVTPPDGFRGEWVEKDLAERAIEPDLFAGVDVVIHLAAVPGRGLVSDRELFTNNATTTYSVLESACEAGVPRIAMASSTSIYGTVWGDRKIAPAEVPLTEDSEIRPADAYALAKEVDESIARMMCRRFDVSVALLRLPNVQTSERLLERSARVEADPAEASRELWAYLTVEDSAEAFRRAAVADFTGCLVVNVASPQPLANIDVASATQQVYPGTPSSLQPGQAGISSDRARRVLGFTASSIVP